MMRISAMLCGVMVVFGCAPAEEQPPAETPAPPAVSLADFAGSWTVSTMGEASDSVLLTYDMTGAADPAGWTITFPGRDPQPMAVTLDGDSVMGRMGPYESALRPGTMVTTDFVSRLENGMLRGTFVARYQTDAADSVLRGRISGSRKTQ
jgi:hypothetical protein